MSKHSTDWLVLVIGVVVLVLGLGDLADTSDVLSAGPWVVFVALLGAGALGLGWSVRSMRARPDQPPPDLE